MFSVKCRVSSCVQSSISFRTKHNVSEVKKLLFSLENVEQLLKFLTFLGLNSMYVTLRFTGDKNDFLKRVLFIIILLEDGKSAEIQCQGSFKMKLVINEFGSVIKHCSYAL